MELFSIEAISNFGNNETVKFEIIDATGKLFPIRVGNTASISYRHETQRESANLGGKISKRYKHRREIFISILSKLSAIPCDTGLEPGQDFYEASVVSTMGSAKSENSSYYIAYYAPALDTVVYCPGAEYPHASSLASFSVKPGP